MSENWSFKDDVEYSEKAIKWLNKDVVMQISTSFNEPKWMLDIRLDALEKFYEIDYPKWGPSLSELDFDEIYYFSKPKWAWDKKSWDDVPENIKNTFDRLWIPEAEKEMLAWVWAQYDSEVVYHSLRQELQEKWVIFKDMSIALREDEELLKKYFAKCIPVNYHKLSALHYAVWSWWTFMYIPKWVKLEEPLQAYFRMNVEAWWQFEHTMIILEDEAEAHYIEGCSAPKYNTNSLHAWWVEVFVWDNAKMRYSSVENWSIDTYNLNTKRAIVWKNAFMEWVSGQMGSWVTMLYPCSVLKWDNSKAEHLSVAFASTWQNQDTWSKVIHMWKNTTSKILSKSISKWWWISTYRGQVSILPSAENSFSQVECDGLILDKDSQSHTIPFMETRNSSSNIAHEATTWRISEDDLFYLMSRWISEEWAKTMIVNGFLSQVVKELPLEYASEMNVLVAMEMEWAF